MNIFSDAVVSQLKLSLSPLQFEEFKKNINDLIKQDGINYIGMVYNLIIIIIIIIIDFI